MELLDEPENPGSSFALHWKRIVEIPLHDEIAVPVDVHMARGVISLPGEKHEPATPDLGHGNNDTTRGNGSHAGLCLPANHWTLAAAA